MTLENFHPFVRHARKLGIECGIYSDFVIPYDCRLFYIAHSSGYVRFADEKYDVKNGDLLIWNSGVKYSMEPTGDSRCLEILALSFDLTNDRSDLSIPISPDGEDCYEPQKRIFCRRRHRRASVFGFASVFQGGVLRRKYALRDDRRVRQLKAIFERRAFGKAFGAVSVPCTKFGEPKRRYFRRDRLYPHTFLRKTHQRNARENASVFTQTR